MCGTLTVDLAFLPTIIVESFIDNALSETTVWLKASPHILGCEQVKSWDGDSARRPRDRLCFSLRNAGQEQDSTGSDRLSRERYHRNIKNSDNG